MAQGTEIPVTPTSNTLTTNSSPVTTTEAIINTQAMTSRVGTRSQSLDVTSTTVNTVLTTSLATLNVETDGGRISMEVSEGIPLLDSEMQSQDPIITRASETKQSNRLVSRHTLDTTCRTFSSLQDALSKTFNTRILFKPMEPSSLPSTTYCAKRSRSLSTSTKVSTQTPDSPSQQPWMAADGSSKIEEIFSPRFLTKMIEMEEERRRLMNLVMPLTQLERLSWDNLQFIRDLIFRTNFSQQSNSSFIAERIRHLQCLTTWILQMLVCDAACVISFRRELENLLESCLGIATHLAAPDTHHDEESFLMRPFQPKPLSFDSDKIEYLTFNPYVCRPRRSLIPLDRHANVSPISQNSTLEVPSLRDEEQFVWVDQGSENGHAYTRYGDPMYQRLCSLQREADTRSSSHKPDELDELTLAETDRQEFHRGRRSRLSERSPETRPSIVSVESLGAQLRETRLRARSQGARNRARSNGSTDPFDDLVQQEEGETLVGRVRSKSSPVIISGPRPINDWVSPFRLNDTVPTIVLTNGCYGYNLPRGPNAHMPFADYENLGVRSDSFSTDSRVTDTSTVMTSIDVNSPRVASLVQLQQGYVDVRDSLPSLVLPEFSAVPFTSVPFIHAASENITREIGSTHGVNLDRLDAREDRGATPKSERQLSRTLSSPELVFHFSDGEELGLRRYSPNQPLYNSSSRDKLSSQPFS